MKTILKHSKQGFTIVELMVSVTIGLVVTWAVTSLFTATSQTFRAQDSASRSQETGRYALSIMSQHIRQAGFFELTSIEQANSFSSFVSQNTNLLSVPAIKGCDGTINYGVTGWACNTVSNSPSSVLVAYQVQSTPTAIAKGINNLVLPGGNVAVGTDCLGQDPNIGSASPRGLVAINYFYIDTAKKRLMCRGNGNQTAKALADGVEDMQLSYGVNASPLSATSTIQYLKASSVSDWSQVVAVRLCLQVKSMQVSGKGSASPGGGANYAGSGVNYAAMNGKDCQGRNWKDHTSDLYNDGVLRKAYWSTITLRNQTPHIPL